ncbi:metallophosphoesterase [Gordonia sp. (in: high G+C Gram-positive bacteria)]|uniref:metallophosphoesterase n=1 Tax=Gordonia sp. (in: high G+C Gram-positive bacteria) TaxID=84139 RepID=UPI0016A0E873|nr:metallophosphoesterase [Gordonia sp. (in: high G+C Gram-positive bacteria)]NLG45600.1 twin-arginine translocation signal domain-containing protein [Gordonia sp. (in: high G+C Gram-positive bacteria)]
MTDNTSQSRPSGLNRRSFLAGTAAVGTAVGLGALRPGEASAAQRFPLPTGADALHVLVTGDAGTGEKPQYAVADAARAIHGGKPFDIALGLGDNIYESGPKGPNDTQFQTKFEKPNAGLDFPWLMTLGNHDNSAVFPGDGGWLLRGDDEVAYHRRSRRWYMPERYYSVSLGVAEFFVLDMNPLAAYIPPFLSPEWQPGGHYMTRQAKWLDKALSASTAPWKIVCTHHPYANNGPHGPAGDFDGLPAPLNGVEMKRFIEKHVAGRANFLFSGHDHSQQVLENVPSLKGTRQIVSGAAGKSVNAKSSKEFRAKYENYTDRGFMTLDITSSSIALNAYEVSANRPGSRKAFSTTFHR